MKCTAGSHNASGKQPNTSSTEHTVPITLYWNVNALMHNSLPMSLCLNWTGDVSPNALKTNNPGLMQIYCFSHQFSTLDRILPYYLIQLHYKKSQARGPPRFLEWPPTRNHFIVDRAGPKQRAASCCPGLMACFIIHERHGQRAATIGRAAFF